MSQSDVLAAAPLIVLVLGACLVLLVDLVVVMPTRALTAIGVVAGIAAAATAIAVGAGSAGFGGALARDGLSIPLTTLVGVATAASLALSSHYLDRERLPAAEFVALVLFSAAGAVIMAAGRDFVVLFLGLEVLSLPLYVLTALLRRTSHGDEGALKYFLLGAAASAVLLYGIALVYSATGSLALGVPPSDVAASPIYLTGLALFLGGLAFKAALVPFHAWVPDAYESAPTPATAFMAVAAKAGAFGALLRLITSAGDPVVQGDWRIALAVLAALTIVVGNLGAVGQRGVKRLLAYSSIAHAGYLTVGVAAGAFGVPAVLFYLLVYGALTVGAFGAIALLDDDEPTLDGLAGLWAKRPLLVAALAVLLLGLTGLPLTGGFLAKVYVFQAALQADLLWLVILGALASVLGTAYYLRILLACFQAGSGAISETAPSRIGTAVVCLCALFVLVLGVLPSPVLDFVQAAAVR